MSSKLVDEMQRMRELHIPIRVELLTTSGGCCLLLARDQFDVVHAGGEGSCFEVAEELLLQQLQEKYPK